jgi:hypothetical protein
MARPSSSPIDIQSVPPDVMEDCADRAFETATNVFRCTIKNQSFIYTIHGPSSERKRKRELPKLGSSPSFSSSPLSSSPLEYMKEPQDFYNEKDSVIQIYPRNSTDSVVLSGLAGNTIIIHSKVNHITMRRCQKIELHLKEEAISGIDILHCQHVVIKLPSHTFTNLEFGENIHFKGELTDVSHLQINGSLDVKVNDIPLPINPFMRVVFGKNSQIGSDFIPTSIEKQSEIPKLMLCRY